MDSYVINLNDCLKMLSILITCIGYFYSHWPDDFVKMSGQ